MVFYTLQGVVSASDCEKRCVIQAVHELYDSHFTTPWHPEETRNNILVFIGKYPLHKDGLREVEF